jgi:hypothetical protein
VLKVFDNGVSHCNKPDTVDSTDGLSASLRLFGLPVLVHFLCSTLTVWGWFAFC